MARLKRVDVASPGFTRRGRGKGFEYLDEHGDRIADEVTLERVRGLVIPPAWRDVWISPEPMGHIQATGFDARGRKQYRYHDDWRTRRDAAKFDSMIEFGQKLPHLRERVASDIARKGMGRERVLGCSTRLLDRGFFRVGSEGYAEENDTYGLATIRKAHVTIEDGVMVFDYNAKGSKRRIQRVDDEDIVSVVETLKRRRGGGPELLAYKRGKRWMDVKSDDINHYVKEAIGGDFSAKDFRTWNATVLAAIALAVSGPAAEQSKTARKKATNRAVKEVARYLGNTPAVARASYIDPRVFDRYDGGMTIGGVLPALVDEDGGWPVIQPQIDAGVIDLLEERTDSDAIEER